MSKRLVVDPQLKLVSMLHDAQGILSNVPREKKGRFIPLKIDYVTLAYFES